MAVLTTVAGRLVYAEARPYSEFKADDGSVRPSGITYRGMLTQAFDASPVKLRFEDADSFRKVEAAGFMGYVEVNGEVYGRGDDQTVKVKLVVAVDAVTPDK